MISSGTVLSYRVVSLSGPGDVWRSGQDFFISPGVIVFHRSLIIGCLDPVPEDTSILFVTTFRSWSCTLQSADYSLFLLLGCYYVDLLQDFMHLSGFLIQALGILCTTSLYDGAINYLVIHIIFSQLVLFVNFSLT